MGESVIFLDGGEGGIGAAEPFEVVAFLLRISFQGQYFAVPTPP